ESFGGNTQGAPSAVNHDEESSGGNTQGTPSAVNHDEEFSGGNTQGAPSAVNHDEESSGVNAQGAPSAVDTDEAILSDEDLGLLPDWVLEGEPVWLEALWEFLQEPKLVVVHVGARDSVAGLSLLPHQELRTVDGNQELRDWGRRELSEAKDSGKKVRPVAVMAETHDRAADCIEVLKFLGFTRIANLRTPAFLDQLRKFQQSKS
ncbi:unnamed protein product, partial [Polarella glacialis]